MNCIRFYRLAPGYAHGKGVKRPPRGTVKSLRSRLLYSPTNVALFQIDMLRWMSRTALELIGQSGLGYTFDPLTEGSEENSYTRGVRKFK